jgi:acyl transferase domain-containing protein
VVAYYRGLVLKEGGTDGGMLAVPLGSDEVQQYLGEDLDVCIACYNSPSSVTLSGCQRDLNTVSKRLQSAGISARSLKTGGQAYHSKHMKERGAVYEKFAQRIFTSRDTSVKSIMISSLFGKKMSSTDFLGAVYWRGNLESPVLFQQAVQRLPLDCPNVTHLLELGPHPTLSGPLRQIRNTLEEEGFSLSYGSTLVRKENAMRSLLNTAGDLFAKHYNIDLDKVNKIGANEVEGWLPAATIVDLPNYAWQYKELPFSGEPRASLEYRFRKFPHHDVLGAIVPGMSSTGWSWKNTLRTSDIAWLTDHRVCS